MPRLTLEGSAEEVSLPYDPQRLKLSAAMRETIGSDMSRASEVREHTSQLFKMIRSATPTYTGNKPFTSALAGKALYNTPIKDLISSRQILYFISAHPNIVDYEALDQYSDSLLHYASLYPAYHLLKELLKHCHLIDQIDTFGNTPLMVACSSNQEEIHDSIMLMLGQHANPNPINQFGECALSLAIKHGNAAALAPLLRAGANVYTPLSGDAAHSISLPGCPVDPQYMPEQSSPQEMLQQWRRRLEKQMARADNHETFNPKYQLKALAGCTQALTLIDEAAQRWQAWSNKPDHTPSRQELLAFASIGKLTDAFIPSLWQGREDDIPALLADLPSAISAQLTGDQPWLAQISLQPSQRLMTAALEYQRLHSTNGPAR